MKDTTEDTDTRAGPTPGKGTHAVTRFTALLLVGCVGCTLETAGMADLLDGQYQATVVCPDSRGGLHTGEPTVIDDGWTCETSLRGTRLSAACDHGDAGFTLWCDAATETRSSAAQFGDCTVQIWCD